MDLDIGQVIRAISIYTLPVLSAIILHEVAHGWVAEKFGDSTARRAGRITLNPISHIDPIGTIIIPVAMGVMGGPIFGWAKPVPVNFAALRNPKQNMIWVALSGPGTNFVLGVASGILLRMIVIMHPDAIIQAFKYGSQSSASVVTSALVPIVLMLCASILLNSILMIINLIPVPPLDGGRIMTGLLPLDLAYKYSRIEPYGFLILILIIFIIPFTGALLSSILRSTTLVFSALAGFDAVQLLAINHLLP